MGYKLAGFDVLGCNEIDKKMMDIYQANHNPKFAFLEGIQTFKERKDLPEELYNLDILDGSPPCSSFSMAGNREADWGKEKHFREGLELQVLDTLFFDFIDLAKELQPKVVIAENVQGLLLGSAMQYVEKIYKAFDDAGYIVQHHLLNSSVMGVPQRRSRVFFFALRKDLFIDDFKGGDLFDSVPYFNLAFNEPEIPFKEIEDATGNDDAYKMYPGVLKYLRLIEPGRACSDVHPKGSFFQEVKLHPLKPLPTLRAGSNSYYHYEEERRLFDSEIIKGGSFPTDYNFLKSKPIYVVGMSVPPIMVKKIAIEVHKQWLSKLPQ